MPRAIWNGSLSFGLVHVPVRAFSATKERAVHFHELDAKTGARIRHKKVSESSGREVDNDRVVSGYEVSPGSWVTLTGEELSAAEPARTHTIEVEDFVVLDEIDPLHFKRSYWLVPGGKDDGARRAYALLRDAMEKTGKAAIGRFVLRTKEHLVAVRPMQGALALHTLFFGDEVVKAASLDGLPVRNKVQPRELQAAEQLIDSLTAAWEPSRYRDTYRAKVLGIIERKRKGEEIVIEAEPERAKVVDLMAALEQSVQEAGKRRSSGKRRTAARRKSA